jgi:hypothetical protein
MLQIDWESEIIFFEAPENIFTRFSNEQNTFLFVEK